MQHTQIMPQLAVYQSVFAGWEVNTGLLDTPDGEVVLIDPGILPDEIRFLRELTAGRPVKLVYNTHCHIDHILGLSAWPDAPRIASQHHTHPRFVERQHIFPQRVAGMEERYQIQWDPPVQYLPPTIVVSGRSMFHDSMPNWELIPVPGHAYDLLALFDHETGTLWASDAVAIPSQIPTLWDGQSGEYLDSLAKLAALDVQCLVPGHGNVATTPQDSCAWIDANRAYLVELRDRVADALSAGRTLDETIEQCMDVPHPPRWKKPHTMNINRIWDELGGER